jgi:hypothetical protein
VGVSSGNESVHFGTMHYRLAGWLAGNSLIYILHRAAVPQEMSTSVPCDERLPALWVSYMEQGDEKLAQDHRYW